MNEITIPTVDDLFRIACENEPNPVQTALVVLSEIVLATLSDEGVKCAREAFQKHLRGAIFMSGKPEEQVADELGSVILSQVVGFALYACEQDPDA